MRKNVRESFRRGAQFIKLCVSGGVVSMHDKITDTQFTVEEIAAAVIEARARNTYVTVHSHNNEGIRNALQAGVECVEHGSYLDEPTAALMAERRAFLIPTVSVIERLVEDSGSAGLPTSIADRAALVLTAMKEAVTIARAAGVRVGLGSDYIGPHQQARGDELVARAAIESPMAALVAATQTNADVLRIHEQVGTISPGKAADLVAWNADPLADPTIFAGGNHAAVVIQAGRVVKDAR
jgi:imidazolonepropionase-like amidohydrolase